MTAPRWQPVTPRLVREHVPTPDGIDFEVPPAEAAIAARWLERVRAERAASGTDPGFALRIPVLTNLPRPRSAG